MSQKMVFLGSDHAGFGLKENIELYLLADKERYLLSDEGCHSTESVDYPCCANAVVGQVARNRADGHDAYGILCCGTGQGMAMTGNMAGIRSAVCFSEFVTERARAHNDAHIMTLGQDSVDYGIDFVLAKKMVDTFLNTEFVGNTRDGMRHLRRVVQMCEYGKEPVVICPSLLGYEAELKKYLSVLRGTPEHGRISNMLEAGIDTLHIDVMTDSFIRRVSGKSPDEKVEERFPLELVRNMRRLYSPDSVRDVLGERKYIRFDVHLMVDNPSEWVDLFKGHLFAKFGGYNAYAGDRITLHYEATEKGLLETLKRIKRLGFEAGVAINPDTPTDELFDSHLIDYADMVLCMTVVPGKGGQAFMDMMPKIRRIKNYYPKLKIQVDGGVDDFTFLKCRDAGATDFVVGSYITSAEDQIERLKTLEI